MDTGGPSREFWRLLVCGVREKYCVSVNGAGSSFDRNMQALQVCTLFIASYPGASEEKK